ncbi:MAG: ATP-binding cassette domain-containing protein [Verrucomicrobia bacterium]|nr:ATP-binding cassette domain-containing protein [Verrucomicrobiota bacterium]
MLTVAALSKAYAGNALFKKISFQVDPGDRIGFVGPNGAGKSTLLEIISGLEAADDGDVIRARSLSVGYLPQETAPARAQSVLRMALGTAGQDSRLPDDRAPGHGQDDHDYHDPAREAEAKRILRGLGFRETDFTRDARELSGGWVMRAHLARLLVSEPGLLLLDEPTNHLDFDSVTWLTQYLQGNRSALLIISHDRTFLNRLVTRIIELERGTLTQYKGNYDAYLEQKAAREEQLASAYRNQEREVARLQAFVDRFRAKASKAAQAQSKLKQIERIRQLEAPTASGARVAFQFPQPRRSGATVLQLTGVCFGYDDQTLFQDLALEISRGQRLAILGRNGTGKSSLLKLMAGLLPLRSGERKLGHNVELSYFSQQRIEMFHPTRTVLEEALAVPRSPGEPTARNVLGAFLFRGDDVFKPVTALSGGEKSRLALAKLLLSPPNFLLLDEPTTHLDIQSVEALVTALKGYEGTMAFVSHDLYLLEQLATTTLYLDGQTVSFYPGGYAYFQDRFAAEQVSQGEKTTAKPETLAGAAAGGIRAGSGKERRRQEAEARQQRSRERKSLEERLNRVEGQILQLENTQKELVERLQTPDAPQAAMELRGVTNELQRLTAEWNELVEAIQAL